MRLVDTHAHLEELTDIEGALERAEAKELVAIVAVGSSTKANEKVLSLAEKFSDLVYAAIGIHPQEAETESREAINFIERHASRCVAIGEIGLDHKYNVNRSRQRKIFENMLQIAKKHEKAVVLHSRGAWNDVLSSVQENNVRKAVFHWYSGPLDTLKKVLDNGYFISATPAVEYSLRHRDAIKTAPVESILLETDTPVRYRGVPSEPSDVTKVLDATAEIKGIAVDQLADATTRNACNLFEVSF